MKILFVTTGKNVWDRATGKQAWLPNAMLLAANRINRLNPELHSCQVVLPLSFKDACKDLPPYVIFPKEGFAEDLPAQGAQRCLVLQELATQTPYDVVVNWGGGPLGPVAVLTKACETYLGPGPIFPPSTPTCYLDCFHAHHRGQMRWQEFFTAPLSTVQQDLMQLRQTLGMNQAQTCAQADPSIWSGLADRPRPWYLLALGEGTTGQLGPEGPLDQLLAKCAHLPGTLFVRAAVGVSHPIEKLLSTHLHAVSLAEVPSVADATLAGQADLVVAVDSDSHAFWACLWEKACVCVQGGGLMPQVLGSVSWDQVLDRLRNFSESAPPIGNLIQYLCRDYLFQYADIFQPDRCLARLEQQLQLWRNRHRL